MNIIKMYEAEPDRSSTIHFSAVEANYTDLTSEPRDSYGEYIWLFFTVQLSVRNPNT